MNTPNTLQDMITGFVVFALVMLVYTLSLILRIRKARRELDLLEQERSLPGGAASLN